MPASSTSSSISTSGWSSSKGSRSTCTSPSRWLYRARPPTTQLSCQSSSRANSKPSSTAWYTMRKCGADVQWASKPAELEEAWQRLQKGSTPNTLNKLAKEVAGGAIQTFQCLAPSLRFGQPLGPS